MYDPLGHFVYFDSHGGFILKRMQDSDHRLIIDFLTVLMIVNFIYLAAQ